MFSLQDKNVLVTGASSGIGRQISIACSRMNARVVLMGRNQQRLDETLAAMQDPARHFSCRVELTQFDKVEAVVKDVAGKIGKISGVVHCAGVSSTVPLRVISAGKMDDIFHNNVSTAIQLTRIVTKPSYINVQGASIVFIASVMSVVGESGKSLYALTKGALVAAAKSLAIELAPRKIRVNCISPGVVVTPMSKGSPYSQKADTLDRIRGLHPLGLGQVEDIAGPCVFLLCEAANWITGANLFVDGGYTAR